jgi:hypothetical protein
MKFERTMRIAGVGEYRAEINVVVCPKTLQRRPALPSIMNAMNYEEAVSQEKQEQTTSH